MVVSFVVAIVIVAAIYYSMAAALSPEPVVKVYTFTKNLESGYIITPLDIKESFIPKSLHTVSLEENIDDIVNKKITADVAAGEFVYSNKLTDRGRIESNYDDLYVIGIDVTNISNSLGTQLKVGDIYHLIYNDLIDTTEENENITIEGNTVQSIEVTILALIDNTGNEVIGDKQTPIKTINVGCKTLEDIEKIKVLEQIDQIEIIRFPKE